VTHLHYRVKRWEPDVASPTGRQPSA
jgi:hypothetical protein